MGKQVEALKRMIGDDSFSDILLDTEPVTTDKNGRSEFCKYLAGETNMTPAEVEAARKKFFPKEQNNHV